VGGIGGLSDDCEYCVEHRVFEALPDTEVDPRWLKVDAIMEEYHVAERKRDEEDAKKIRKIMKGG
jgi:hypothetical protein